jgi:hypothetical protein
MGRVLKAGGAGVRNIRESNELLDEGITKGSASAVAIKRGLVSWQMQK